MADPVGFSIDISLASGTAKAGQAWDDGELVRAYDAALEEFHLHHPGPGTWLDKMTAAKGQPLPGARTFGTDWYRDSDTAPQKPKKRAADNPYTGTAKKIKPREDSPVYNPPSPLHGGSGAEPPESPHDSGYSANTLSGEAAARATYEEAIGFAMSAQYAAGYWLGVAHTKAKSSPVSNILHTRQEHTSAKLKR